MTFEQFHAAEGEELYDLFRKGEAKHPDDEIFHRELFRVVLQRGFLRGQESQLDIVQAKVG